MIQNGQSPFVRGTDVAVEIATEQMRVRVQRQECRITCFDVSVVVCLLKIQIWVWAGAWGYGRLEADRS